MALGKLSRGNATSVIQIHDSADLIHGFETDPDNRDALTKDTLDTSPVLSKMQVISYDGCTTLNSCWKSVPISSHSHRQVTLTAPSVSFFLARATIMA